jgi:hypothetical protein
MVKLLLSHGAQINKKAYDALACAVENGRRNVVELVLETGVNDHSSLPPFLVGAAEYGKNDMIELY